MPIDDPDDLTLTLRLRAAFVDRVGEAEALSVALLQHRARIDGNLIDSGHLRNVLCFYGEGGVGKTELSRQLADWVAGSPAPAHWGPPPTTRVDAVVRWDVNDSRGGLDPVTLLAALRVQLGLVERTWPAFDLSFSALHRAVRPGIELTLRAPRSGTTTLSDVVAGLVSDAAALTGIGVAGGAGAAAVGISRGVLARAHARSIARRTAREYPKLEQLLSDCEAASSVVEETAELAGRAAFMLTLQVDRMEPTERPLIVVFVDHMERLQVAGERHLGEATLNRLVARLPYCLFVVTGRNSLRWHEQASPLPTSGPAAWPLLSTETPPHDEPRQHQIGNLSESDAAEFLSERFQQESITVPPALIAELARETDGWPLHLHTIVDVAIERTAAGRALTAGDLGGSFPSLVERLLSDLPGDVADAFRAACLLPYFDIEFVAAAGALPSGPVERLLRRQLVRPNPGSVYPYRIHDRLRELVRQTGSAADGGWGERDWAQHAERALAEAKRRFDSAMERMDDVAAIESLALGINVATENDVFDGWIIRAIRTGPSIDGLAPLIPASAEADTPPDLADTLEFLELKARVARDDVTLDLDVITRRGSPISSTAGRFRAYELRKRGRIDEAVQQLEWLLEEYNDQPAVYRNQIVTTLRLARRFSDALVRAADLTEVQRQSQLASIARRHGRYDGSSAQFESQVRGATSRRFQIELTGDWLNIRHRELGITNDEALAVLATASATNQLKATSDALSVLAQMHLFDDELFERYFGALVELNGRRFQVFDGLALTLALRAWTTDDMRLAIQAREVANVPFRSATWLATEVLLEHLGVPLDPVETQWLEPYEVVRDRWLALLGQTVDRARARAT